MQSQNLLRFFIPVLSLTPEELFFPVPEYFLSEAKFVSAYPVQWEHQKQVIPFILQSLLQRTDITLPSVLFSLNIPHFMSFIIRLSKAFAFSVLICGVFPTSKFFKLSCSWSLPLALDEVILSQMVFAFFFLTSHETLNVMVNNKLGEISVLRNKTFYSDIKANQTR